MVAPDLLFVTADVRTYAPVMVVLLRILSSGCSDLERRDMAVVLEKFPQEIVGRDGLRYRAQAVGAATADGLWEGWIEFIQTHGGSSVRTARETIQPNRRDSAYWATGLTTVYLEGALERALHPLLRREPDAAEPFLDEPAPGNRARRGP